MANAGQQPPRYERPVETATAATPSREVTPPSRHEEVMAASTLSDGSKRLLRGLMQLGQTATFPGGGLGLDYAGLLKTAVRPDILQGHVEEAAAVLRRHRVDLLLVPGMSGFPIGTMYAASAGIPALLLRKEPWRGEGRDRTLPPGAFVLPSYTSSNEVVMTADPNALLHIANGLFEQQVATQSDKGIIQLVLRIAGADDIVDKAVMARAVCDSAHRLGTFAASAWQRAWQVRTGDDRSVNLKVEVVTWVTPLNKHYNQTAQQLASMFEGEPFAGLSITGLYTAPRAIGIDGVGILAFCEPDDT